MINMAIRQLVPPRSTAAPAGLLEMDMAVWPAVPPGPDLRTIRSTASLELGVINWTPTSSATEQAQAVLHQTPRTAKTTLVPTPVGRRWRFERDAAKQNSLQRIVLRNNISRQTGDFRRGLAGIAGATPGEGLSTSCPIFPSPGPSHGFAAIPAPLPGVRPGHTASGRSACWRSCVRSG